MNFDKKEIGRKDNVYDSTDQSLLEKLVLCRNRRKYYARFEKEIKGKIMKLSSGKGSVSDGEISVSLENVIVTRVNIQKIRNEYPEIVDKCSETSTHTRAIVN